MSSLRMRAKRSPLRSFQPFPALSSPLLSYLTLHVPARSANVFASGDVPQPETGRKQVQKIEPMPFASASGESVQAAAS